jgi:hypothetical protein
MSTGADDYTLVEEAAAALRELRQWSRLAAREG